VTRRRLFAQRIYGGANEIIKEIISRTNLRQFGKVKLRFRSLDFIKCLGGHKNDCNTKTLPRNQEIKMRRLSLALALLCCGIGSGWCEAITVEQLHGDCASPNGSEGQTACAAYLMGMVHGLQMGTLFTKRGKPFCIPGTIKSPEAIQMFNKAAAETPEMQKETADLLWIMTLSSNFRCSKSK
jgi:hypothetical protein